MKPGSNMAWRRFRRNRAASAGLVLLIVTAAVCFATLGWSSRTMSRQDLEQTLRAPSARQLFGTDHLGRSLLARTLYGGTISISLGLLATGISVVIGTLYGAVAGYVGGRCDAVMMRIVDVLYALPYILLVMLLTLSLGEWIEATGIANRVWSRLLVLAIAIGGVSWLNMARVIRGQVLSLREQPYVEAARALGVPPARILLRHVLPNTIGPVIVFGTLTVPQAILQESFLSFLGVGVQPPHATWGSLAAEGIQALNPIQLDWWLVLFPCVALSLTLLALNFVGDGIRDAFELRSR